MINQISLVPKRLFHRITTTRPVAVLAHRKTRKTLIYLKNSGILLDYAGDSPSFFVQRWQRGAAVTILAFGYTSKT